MYRDTPQPIFLKDYQPPVFLIDRVTLHFDLGETETRVATTLEVRRNPAVPRGEDALQLHGEGLELRSLRLDGRALEADEYRLDATGLSIPGVPERFRLETEVLIHPEQNTALEGLYRSGGLFCTQCEAEGFRKITYFIDRPDVMARFTTRIVAERARYPVLLSNGNPVEQRDLGDGRHLVCWEDPFPKPCYLFALVGGNLCWVEDRYRTGSGREVLLRVYSEPENVDKCDHALRSLTKAMRWDEERFGREYDLDIYMIVAVNDFNMGAMENKGLNVFNTKYVLARPETATDGDFLGIEGVIAHEYFHNWTGNRITCRDWFQLSLKEGLTVYRDQEFSADRGSRGVKRIEDVRRLRTHQFAEDAGPMAHPVRPASYIEINNFYTTTVYEKGAEVVRMQATLLGAEKFREAMDLYFRRHDGQAVTTEDFVRCMEAVSGRDLQQFRRWYEQAGTPELHVTAEHDSGTRRLTLNVRQQCPPTPGQPDKPPFHIPLAVGLVGPDGADLPLRLEGEEGASTGTRILELRAETEVFHFVEVPEGTVPSLLRGFSAPVKVRYDYPDAELMFLMAHDSDGFCRWDAAQTLAERVLLAAGGESDHPVVTGFIEAFRAALADGSADRSLLSEVLTLPSESYLAEQSEPVDVEGIHRSREGLKTHIARALRAELLATYLGSTEARGFEITPEAIARRRLKNLCLGYLMQLGDPEVTALCLGQFQAASNMTDVVAALALLADHPGPEGDEALGVFYQRWRSDTLVLDKWFSIQATSKRPETLERVTGLLGHPAFSLRNPNKVYSLIGAFSGSNPVRFHDPSGRGYRFLADRVLELDPLNAQIAARLLRRLAPWRRYDSHRQDLMRAELERVLSRQALSKDSYEVASRSLAS